MNTFFDYSGLLYQFSRFNGRFMKLQKTNVLPNAYFSCHKTPHNI